MAFTRAERKKVFIKLAVTGPSGSGKTFGALKLAGGIGQKIALLDTENGSASLYADILPFDVMDLAAPFIVPKYVDAIKEAAAAGYDVLVVDSLSHAWAGEGGLLSKKEALDTRGGNQYTNWASITKEHEALKAAILQAPIHVIATMRSKQEYVVEQDSRGKSTPRKVGMAPIQRDGMEYEFTTVFDVSIDHTAITSKDRTGLFDGMNERLSDAHGKKIVAWLGTGAEPAPTVPRPSTPAPATAPGPAQSGKAAAPNGNGPTYSPSEAREKLTSILAKHSFGDAQAKKVLAFFDDPGLSDGQKVDHAKGIAAKVQSGELVAA